MTAIQADVAPNVPPPRWIGTLQGVLVALFLVGAASLVYGLSGAGPALDLPLLTASFLYLMGVTQAGVVFCAIGRLVGAHWSKPYYRLAELATLAFAPFAVATFLLLFFFGQDELFHWVSRGAEADGGAGAAAGGEGEHVSPWLNPGWLLLRNSLGLLIFYALSAVYALTALRPDLAPYSGAEQDETARRLYLSSPLVILSFALCNTLFAWDFGMMLIEHWHSTVFPIYFSFGNLFAGTAALVFFAAVLRRSPGSEFGPAQIRCLGMLVTAFTVLWLYFFWAQFFVVWFGNLPRETDALWRQMYGHYAPYFWTMMAGCFFVPFTALIFAVVKRSLLAMSLIAVAINVGIWLNKYLTVVPAFSADDRPFDGLIDIAVAAGLLAGFLAALIMLAKRYPMFSHWEIGRTPASKR